MGWRPDIWHGGWGGGKQRREALGMQRSVASPWPGAEGFAASPPRMASALVLAQPPGPGM